MGVGAQRHTGQRLCTNLTKCTSVRVCRTYSLEALTHGHSVARQIRATNPPAPPGWAHPDVILHNNAGVCVYAKTSAWWLGLCAMCDYFSWPIDNGSMRCGATAKFTYQVWTMSVRVEQDALLMRLEKHTHSAQSPPDARARLLAYIRYAWSPLAVIDAL